MPRHFRSFSPLTDAEIEADAELTRNQRRATWPSHSVRHLYPRNCHAPNPELNIETAETGDYRFESRWTAGLRRIAAPGGVPPALRVRQQRHAAFATIREALNVIGAEAWENTARSGLPGQGRRDRPNHRKLMSCHGRCCLLCVL